MPASGARIARAPSAWHDPCSLGTSSCHADVRRIAAAHQPTGSYAHPEHSSQLRSRRPSDVRQLVVSHIASSGVNFLDT